jgi:hypothetical protein
VSIRLRAAGVLAALLLTGGCPARHANVPAAGAFGPPTFRHPGVLVNRGQLDLLRARVRDGLPPQAASWTDMQSHFGALSWTPRPRAVVDCGPYSRPNNGCTDERDDAVAAYTHALAWYVTGQEAHARKAAEVLAAWSAVLRGHTGHNARLQAGWAAAVLPRAGEILRHTFPGWPPAQAAAFAGMLRAVYLPTVTQSAGGTNGNWDLVMIEAAVQMGVFLDDRAVFDRAIERWRRRVPAYIYMKADGPLPRPPPPDSGKDAGDALWTYWHGQRTLVDGLAQETCRDFGHTEYGLASIASVAETAFQQGIDLYAEQSDRLRAALELHAEYLLGKPAPDWLCGGRLDLGGVLPTWEIAYNHLQGRRGLPLPATGRLIQTRVRGPRGANHHIVWETFTHADTGWAGLR